MNSLPLYGDIIIRQGRTLTLPICIREEEYDDEAGTVVDIGPWDTAGMFATFAVRPVITLGEYGDPILEGDTVNGGVEVGIQGIPGFETSVMVWIDATTTLNLEPFSLAVWEVAIYNAGEWISAGEGKAYFQRQIAANSA